MDADCLAAAVRMADHLIAQLGRLGLTLDKTGATLVLYPDSATGATVPLKAASTASLSGKVAVKLAAYPAAFILVVR